MNLLYKGKGFHIKVKSNFLYVWKLHVKHSFAF